eukprot:932057-Prorocentrum_minimum.AAC.1
MPPKSAYLADLDEQIRLKRERQAKEREQERQLDAKIDAQIRQANVFPWDSGRKGGGGDPFVDEYGDRVTDLKDVMSGTRNISLTPSRASTSYGADHHPQSNTSIRSRMRLPAFAGASNQPANQMPIYEEESNLAHTPLRGGNQAPAPYPPPMPSGGDRGPPSYRVDVRQSRRIEGADMRQSRRFDGGGADQRGEDPLPLYYEHDNDQRQETNYAEPYSRGPMTQQLPQVRPLLLTARTIGHYNLTRATFTHHNLTRATFTRYPAFHPPASPRRSTGSTTPAKPPHNKP